MSGRRYVSVPWHYVARRTPGDLIPSVWMAEIGPDAQNVAKRCEHRTMLGARLCRFWRELGRRLA